MVEILRHKYIIHIYESLHYTSYSRDEIVILDFWAIFRRDDPKDEFDQLHPIKMLFLNALVSEGRPTETRHMPR